MSRFMHLFQRLDAVHAQNQANQTMQVEGVEIIHRQQFRYETTNVAREMDFTNQLIPIPPRDNLEPFLQTWESVNPDHFALYLNCYRDYTLFEWILHTIFAAKGHIVNNIAAGRCAATMAFGGYIVIQPQSFDVSMALLAILMELKDTANQFDICRLRCNIDFPATYSIFPIEYSLSLARVNTFYLPFQPTLKLFVKPAFCVQYYLMPIPGYLLGEQEDFTRHLMYSWDVHHNRFELVQPNRESISVLNAGRIAQDYHNYQAYYQDHLMANFNIGRRPYNDVGTFNDFTLEEKRKRRIMRKLSCWAEKWLFYDYEILTRFTRKEQYRTDRRPRDTQYINHD